ncbi:type IIL restriction-modification enzyme MmeI [Brachybacterium avium]|uniref:type IIL restriction-modification enzyme MmeI n=1 Tax=Brachybacterium avium TaxID=2017485 RepID=UPI003084699B
MATRSRRQDQVRPPILRHRGLEQPPSPPADRAATRPHHQRGKAVLEARSRHGQRSLAEHYTPLTMDADLVKAHDSLDAAVDKAFGARRRCTSEQQRQQILFERFAEMTSN